MTLEEIKETQWYQDRPEIIKQAICHKPPTQHYRFKESGKQCMIISYEENAGDTLQDITCTVKKTAIGGPLADMGFSLEFDKYGVFGVKLDDLEPLGGYINTK